MRTTYVKRDLGELNFGDKRITTRYEDIISSLSTSLSDTVPQVSGSGSKTKAMYRFFKNAQVTPRKMLHQHTTSYNSILSKQNRILHVMDTVEYDFTNKRSSSNLGPLNDVKRRGTLQHNSLLLRSNGAPLGLLKQSYIIRSDAFLGQAKQRKRLPFHKKESYRWYEHFIAAQELCKSHTNLEVVSVADREADIMELFQARSCSRMHFVIRSKHNRQLATRNTKKDKKDKLHDVLSNSPLKGTYEIQVYHPITKKRRKACLELRFTSVQIQLHKSSRANKGKKEQLPPFRINAIEAKEINPPKDLDKPINWKILTTLPVEDFDQALEVIKYYCRRWIIERFHFTLKSGGANVEDLQLTQAHRIKNAITAYSIAAMNVFKIRYWAEHEPMTSIYEIGITPIEHKVLYKYAEQQKHIKVDTTFDEQNPPNIKEFSILLGLIAGFIPSKRQPIPGIKIINRAVLKLNHLIDAYLIFCQRTE